MQPVVIRDETTDPAVYPAPPVEFTRFNQWKWCSPGIRDHTGQGQNTNEAVHRDVIATFEQYGMRLDENADIGVSVSMNTTTVMVSDPFYDDYSGYGWGWPGWGYNDCRHHRCYRGLNTGIYYSYHPPVRILPVTQANISVYDNRCQRLLWRSSGTSRITDMQSTQNAVREAIEAALQALAR